MTLSPRADLLLAVGLAPRKTGRQPLVFTGRDLEAADQARPGWCPAGLTVEQAARLYLLLATLADVDVFERRLNQLCVTCLLYTSPRPRARTRYRMPSSA